MRPNELVLGRVPYILWGRGDIDLHLLLLISLLLSLAALGNYLWNFMLGITLTTGVVHPICLIFNLSHYLPLQLNHILFSCKVLWVITLVENVLRERAVDLDCARLEENVVPTLGGVGGGLLVKGSPCSLVNCGMSDFVVPH